MTDRHNNEKFEQHKQAVQLEIKAHSIVSHLKLNGFQSYYAGGCVRDIILNRIPNDYDIATNATPDQIETLFPHTIPIGKTFGIINVMLDDDAFEVATFRRDLDYTDGRRPSAIEFGTITEDAQRRDFTINGLYYDPDKKEILDFVNGQKDIAAKIIRAIGEPNERFQEDHLRLMRAVRFSNLLGFQIEPQTAKAIKENAHLLKKVSGERIEQELTKMLLDVENPSAGFQMLHELNLLTQILPEVEAMIGEEQPPEFHPEGDVFTHTMLMLDSMHNPTRPLAYSILLHDVGKPLTASIGKGRNGKLRIRFDGHAKVSGNLVKKILKRLRLPKAEIDQIEIAVRDHMRFMDVQKMKPSTLRRLIGRPTYDLELALHYLDCSSSHGKLDNYNFLKNYVTELNDEPVLPKPLITGNDIMNLGLTEGPRIGWYLKKAYDVQLNNQNTNREGLLDLLRKEIIAKQKRDKTDE